MTPPRAARGDGAPLDVAILQAGLAIIVLVALPTVPRAFEAPKEAAVSLISAFVFLLTAATPGRIIRAWPRRWLILLAIAPIAMTCAAALEGSHLFASRGAVRIWVYACFGLALRLACVEAGDVARLAGAAAILGAVEAVLILLQVPFGGAIADVSLLPSAKWLAFGTIGNPNWVGAFLAATLPLAWQRASNGAGAPRVARLAWGTAVAAIGGALVLTFSRGAWVGAAAGIVSLAAASAPARRWRPMAMAVLGAAAGAAVAAASLPEEQISAAVTRTASVSGRARMWRITLDMIADQPLRGVGPGAFAAAFPAYQQRHLQRLDDPPPLTQLTDQPHNEYLRLFAESGAAGLAGMAIACVLAVAVWWRRGRSSSEPAGTDLAAGLAALLVCALFDNPLQIAPTTALFCLYVIGLLSLAANAPPAEPTRRLGLASRATLAAVALLLLGQGARVLAVERNHATARAAIARRDWTAARQSARAGLRLEGRHDDLWAIAARAAAARDDGAEFAAALAELRRTGLNPSFECHYAEAEMARNRPRLAAEALTALRETLPGLVRPRLLLARAYLQMGEIAAARGELAAIPEVPSNRGAAAQRLREEARQMLDRLDEISEQERDG